MKSFENKMIVKIFSISAVAFQMLERFNFRLN